MRAILRAMLLRCRQSASSYPKEVTSQKKKVTPLMKHVQREDVGPAAKSTGRQQPTSPYKMRTRMRRRALMKLKDMKSDEDCSLFSFPQFSTPSVAQARLPLPLSFPQFSTASVAQARLPLPHLPCWLLPVWYRLLFWQLPPQKLSLLGTLLSFHAQPRLVTW